MAVVEVSERSRAIVVAEDLAKCAETLDRLYEQLNSAGFTLRSFAKEGEDAASFGPGAERLAALRRLLSRHADEEIKGLLIGLDRIYGVSEEVDW